MTSQRQAGTVNRYFRADADKDISADVFSMSLDELTWTPATYIATASLPPSVAAVDAARAPGSGRVGYWFVVLTGPATPLPLLRGTNVVHGRCVDSPETPHFGWTVYVGASE